MSGDGGPVPRQQVGAKIRASTINAIGALAEAERRAVLPTQVDVPRGSSTEISLEQIFVEVGAETVDVAVDIVDADGNQVGTATFSVKRIVQMRTPRGLSQTLVFSV